MFNLVSGLSGFAGEFANETDRIRQENQHRQDQELDTERAALLHLASTADNPKVKASAITALLTPKGTGGSGLSKWFNQQQSHPIFDQVHQLISGEGPGGQPSGIGPAYLDPGEKERVQTEGRASGAESGTFAGIERAGAGGRAAAGACRENSHLGGRRPRQSRKNQAHRRDRDQRGVLPAESGRSERVAYSRPVADSQRPAGGV